MPTAMPATATPFGFAGQYTDFKSGLVAMRARYYDPLTGQFLTRDPLASLTRQPYAYARGNPVSLNDPSGLEAGAAAAALAGAGKCSTGFQAPFAVTLLEVITLPNGNQEVINSLYAAVNGVATAPGDLGQPGPPPVYTGPTTIDFGPVATSGAIATGGAV